MGILSIYDIPNGCKFSGKRGTEVKTTSECSEFGNFGRFQVRIKVWVIGVVMLNLNDYFWLFNIIVL
jgi:hypothetical protein